MSRIGKAPIEFASNVNISVSKSNLVTVKGPKGELNQQIDPDLTLEVNDGVAELKRPTDQKRHRSVHGLYRTLLANCIEGVTNGYKLELELVGVGYRCTNAGQLLELTLGYSHPIYFMVPNEVSVSTVTEKGKSPTVVLESIDKQLIGQVAAKIREFRKVEPYKGKGIRFAGEVVRRKAGKTSAS
jgi:large subunit ribosomal protein L6